MRFVDRCCVAAARQTPARSVAVGGCIRGSRNTTELQFHDAKPVLRATGRTSDLQLVERDRVESRSGRRHKLNVQSAVNWKTDGQPAGQSGTCPSTKSMLTSVTSSAMESNSSCHQVACTLRHAKPSRRLLAASHERGNDLLPHRRVEVCCVLGWKPGTVVGLEI